MRNLQIEAEVAQQIKDAEKFQRLDSVSKAGDNISEFLMPDTPEVRDDRSIGSKSSVSIGASKHLEEAMVASSKSERADGSAPVTRICLTGGPCAGKTTAMSAL
jgi:hypothetical protein